MKSLGFARAMAVGVFICGLAGAAAGQTTPTITAYNPEENVKPEDIFGDGKIRLIFRLDDIGFNHASNTALQTIIDEGGYVSAVSVLVNTGWLDEAVEILKKHPEISVGVHTCLNAEWRPYRWGPVSPIDKVPSLVDEWGKFFGTRQEFMDHKPNLDEVEKELRAQIDLAVRKGLKLSYIDHHMSTAATTAELKARFEKVARSYGLPVSRWVGEVQGPVVYSSKPADKVDTLVTKLKKLEHPGVYLVVCHVGTDSPEMQVLTDVHPNAPKPMWEYRFAEMKMLWDPKVKQVIKEKGFEVVGYDVMKEKFYSKMKAPE
ncbi:MAG: ChbG/HpnK family deacetylase [bacterium]